MSKEDYGDYQAMRMDEEAHSKTANPDYWSWMKAAEMEDEERLASGDHTHDEYTSQRINNSHYAPKSLNWDKILLPGESPPVQEIDYDDLGIGALLFANEE